MQFLLFCSSWLPLLLVWAYVDVPTEVARAPILSAANVFSLFSYGCTYAPVNTWPTSL
jgi:hypothetical protein